MGERKVILWASDSPLGNTGYSTISRNVCNRLAEKGYEVHFLAHNYHGQTLPPGGVTFKDGMKLNFELIGAGMQPYCADLIEPTIRRLQADVFITLLDTFMVFPLYNNLNFSPARSIFYFPSDGGGGLPLQCESILKKMTLPIAMAKFGQKQVKEYYNINAGYIPHAVDVKNYYPLTENEKVMLKKKYGLEGKFVIGIVARNQGRKMLDRTFKAFNLIKDKMPNAVLFMHSDPEDPAQVFPMREMIRRYGLENRVIFSGMKWSLGFEYKDMNEVYNVMDLFFLTTSGEGFGIPIIEAMACEIPCIVTDYTTTQELLIEDGICGEAVPISCELTGSWMVERALMSDDEAAKILLKLYSSPELRKQYGKVGREKVLRNYNWDTVIEQWIEVIERLTNK